MVSYLRHRTNTKTFKARGRAPNPVTAEELQAELGGGSVVEQQSGVRFYIYDSYLVAQASSLNAERQAKSHKIEVLQALKGKYNIQVIKETVLIQKGWESWGGGRRGESGYKTPKLACGNIYAITPIAQDSEDYTVLNERITSSTNAANEIIGLLQTVSDLKAELLTLKEVYANLGDVNRFSGESLKLLDGIEKFAAGAIEGLREDIRSGNY